jgi:asparagine synthase (glutamine-hydrolysing)
VLDVTGSRNHESLPDERGFLEELDLVLWHMDEPFHTASLHGHWKLMELTRNAGNTVLLDGQGGDEAFLGYHFLLYPWCTSASFGRDGCLRQSRRLRGDGGGIRFRSVALLRRFCGFQWRTGFDLAEATVDRSGAADAASTPAAEDATRPSGLWPQHLAPPMHNHEEDRNSMAFSLEARNPFLDYRIVEVGLALDSHDLLRQGLSKWVLREAMGDLLPPTIVDRADKQGFAADESDWLRRGELGAEIEAAFQSKTSAERPYFRPDPLLAMSAAHRGGQQHEFVLWRAFAVERWLRLFIDPADLQPPANPSPVLRARDT